MSNATARMTADDVVLQVQTFEARFGRVSLMLAAHAAVAHRLRPEIVALIRGNFFTAPDRFQASHDADVLFGPLCAFQGGGFFEMQPDVKEFLVDVLDRITPRSLQGRFRSQDVARLLRHHFRSVESHPAYATPRYYRFRQENLWRAIAIDDPVAVRSHIQAHAKRRNEIKRDSLSNAPRGAGIIAVTGSALRLYNDDLAYLEAQDLIADGQSEAGIALLELLVESGADRLADPDLIPSDLLREERSFVNRHRNMVAGDSSAGIATGAAALPAGAKTVSTDNLTVDSDRLHLCDTKLTKAVIAGDQAAFAAALSQSASDIDQLDRYGMAALHHAIRTGQPEMALQLMQAGADINVQSASDATPLYFMGYHGLTDLARIFLERGATIQRVTAKKSTPLMTACYYGHRDLVELLLAQPDANAAYVNISDDNGFTALYWALSVGDAVLYDMLLAAGAKPPVPMADGYSHLHAAVAGKSVGLVTRILETGYRADPLTGDGWAPLHVACSDTPSLDVVELLLDCGADPYRETVHGWTPSRLAAWWDNLEIMVRLSAIGVPLARQHYFDAAQGGACRTLDFLLASQAADVDPRQLVEPMVLSGNPNAVRYMLDRPEQFQAGKDEVLSKAVAYGKHEIVTLYHAEGWDLPAAPEPSLIQNGQKNVADHWIAAISRCDRNWLPTMTALLDWPEARAAASAVIFARAVEKGQAGLVQLFLDRGWPLPSPPASDDAGPMAADDSLSGWLPLLNKASAGWRETAEVLLSWPEFRVVAGAAIFEAAIGKGHIDVFDLFEKNGWEVPSRPTSSPGWAWVVGSDLKDRDAIVLELISRPDAVTGTKDGRWLIHLATEHGLLRTLEALIAKADDVDVKDRANRTPLSIALATGSAAAITILLQAGADPNAIVGVHHQPAFFQADPDHLPLLLKHGADLRRTGLNGRTWPQANMVRRDGRSLSILPMAVENGADVNAADVAGYTALHLAAEQGSLRAIAPLLASGADPEAQTVAGLTSLHLALFKGHGDVAAALLGGGANARARTPGGLGLLHLAAEQDMADLVAAQWADLEGDSAVSIVPSRTVLQVAVESHAGAVVIVLIGLKVDLDRAAGATPPPVMLAVNARAYEIAERLLKAGAASDARDPVTGRSLADEVASHCSNFLVAKEPIPEALARVHLLVNPEAREPFNDNTPTTASAGVQSAASQLPRLEQRSKPDIDSPFAGLPSLSPVSRSVAPIGSSAAFLALQSDPAWAGWSLASGGRIGTYSRALRELAKRDSASPISEYAERPLSFYPDAELVRLSSNRWQGPHTMFLLSVPGKISWLDGTVRPLHETNAQLPVRLSGENVLEYLRFYGFFVRDVLGPLHFADDPGDPDLASADAQTNLLLERFWVTPTIETIAGGGFQCTATTYHGTSLERQVFLVSANGDVEIRARDVLATGLPLRLDLPIS